VSWADPQPLRPDQARQKGPGWPRPGPRRPRRTRSKGGDGSHSAVGLLPPRRVRIRWELGIKLDKDERGRQLYMLFWLDIS
jgi:hypothetical protein